MLKKESEESEQLTTPSNLEVHPRSILKSNPHSRLIQTANVVDDAVRISRTEGNTRSIENQNQSSEIIKLCEKLNDSNVTNMARLSSHCPCDDTQTIVSKESDTFENEVSTSSHKITIFQNNETSSDNVDNFKIDAVPSFATKRYGNKRNENFLVGKLNRLDVGDNDDDENKINKTDDNEKDINKEEENEEEEEVVAKHDDEDDDHASSSSGGHEIHNIIDEKRVSVARGPINSLAKSVSQHSFDDDRRKQHRGLPLPGLCRSATQVLASIETSETPIVSIADRLAALRHNGSTNWRRRVAGGRADETCDDSLFSADESTTPVKSNVLADCLEKLESATENWKSRIAASDAVNFTVAGKMRVIQSKDVTSPFLPKVTADVTSQKKKVPRPQRFRTRKGKNINTLKKVLSL